VKGRKSVTKRSERKRDKGGSGKGSFLENTEWKGLGKWGNINWQENDNKNGTQKAEQATAQWDMAGERRWQY